MVLREGELRPWTVYPPDTEGGDITEVMSVVGVISSIPWVAPHRPVANELTYK